MFSLYTCENNNSSPDIFSYYRKKYHTSNPHETGQITVEASSQGSGVNNQSHVSTIISDDNYGRFVSLSEENANLTITFNNKYFSLISYSIETHQLWRFINTWDLYGIKDNQLYLLDRRVDSPVCKTPPDDNYCLEDNNESFFAQNGGVFNKFIMILRDTDSYGQYFLSMNKLYFYGSLYRYVLCKTNAYILKSSYFLNLFIDIFILHS